MTHIRIRRGAAALGASALIGLALAGPASARPDPGDRSPVSSGSSVTAGDVRQHESASGQGQSSAQLLKIEQQYSYTMKPEAPTPPIKVITVDSNTIEYLQVGAGALAGMAVVGAGALALSQVHRRNAATV